MKQRYRQKAEIAYLVLQGVSSSPIIPSALCRYVNVNRDVLHQYLDVFIKEGLIEKKTVENVYNGKVQEYSLTSHGRMYMVGLKNINKGLTWIYDIQ